MTGNSDVRDVLRLLYLEGLRIETAATGAPVVKGGTPSPDLQDRLKAGKEHVIAVLTDQAIGSDDPGFALPRRYVVPPGCIAERACARLGWCGEALTRRSCDHARQEAAR